VRQGKRGSQEPPECKSTSLPACLVFLDVKFRLARLERWTVITGSERATGCCPGASKRPDRGHGQTHVGSWPESRAFRCPPDVTTRLSNLQRATGKGIRVHRYRRPIALLTRQRAELEGQSPGSFWLRAQRGDRRPNGARHPGSGPARPAAASPASTFRRRTTEPFNSHSVRHARRQPGAQRQRLRHGIAPKFERHAYFDMEWDLTTGEPLPDSSEFCLGGSSCLCTSAKTR
jgi:hypothetical protein